jgi:hypothetical protein
MALVGVSAPFARCREWLAGTTSGPDFAVGWPSGESKGERPAADASEEMSLPNPGKVGSCDFFDASVIYPSCRDLAGGC